MKEMFNKILIVLIIYWSHEVNSANILGFFSTPSRSHFIIHQSLMKGLAAKGHNITVISGFSSDKLKQLPLNYHELQFDSKDDGILHEQLAKKLKTSDQGTNFLTDFPKMIKHITRRSSDALKDPVTQHLLKSNQKFDLVVLGWFFNDFQLGLAGHFQCPSVVISTVPSIKFLRDFVANPSDVPLYTFHGKPIAGPPSFLQRAQNIAAYIFEFFFTIIINQFYFEPYYEENFPANKNYPSFSDVKKNVSLVLVNNHFSLGAVRSYVPNMVEISGIQIKNKPDLLPEKIRVFLDSAENGAILFSLGTNVKSSDLTADKLLSLFSAFAKLKQKIVWKWDGTKIPEEKPENVLMEKWLPQDDILAHPNIRLFISHCGLGGITEAQFHGVPILGIPIFADQLQNSKAIVNDGWALEIAYNQLTETSLSFTINELLSNHSFTDTVKKLSKSFRDRPNNALDTAVYWTEYVLRHNGAKFMQSPAVHLNFIQRNSLDIISVVAGVIYTTIKLIKWLIKILIRSNVNKIKIS